MCRKNTNQTVNVVQVARKVDWVWCRSMQKSFKSRLCQPHDFISGYVVLCCTLRLQCFFRSSAHSSNDAEEIEEHSDSWSKMCFQILCWKILLKAPKCSCIIRRVLQRNFLPKSSPPNPTPKSCTTGHSTAEAAEFTASTCLTQMNISISRQALKSW